MKRNEIVDRLTTTLELTKAPEIRERIVELIADLSTSTREAGVRIARFVHVNERVLDPNHKYPKQMIACHDILSALGKPVLTLDEVKSAIGENAEVLATKQDPYRIYAFYQKRMEEEGWLSREKVEA